MGYVTEGGPQLFPFKAPWVGPPKLTHLGAEPPVRMQGIAWTQSIRGLAGSNQHSSHHPEVNCQAVHNTQQRYNLPLPGFLV